MKTNASMVIIGLCFLFAVAPAFSASPSIKWTIGITPANSCLVEWSTTSPAASGSTNKSFSIAFNEGSYVTLRFVPQPEYKLMHVFKNAEEWIGFLDGRNSYRFGPVGSPHFIAAISQLVNPVGTFTGNATGSQTNLTAVADITGTYDGLYTNAADAAVYRYHVTAAQDEAGKVLMQSGYATVNGDGRPLVKDSAGNATFANVNAGVVKTVTNGPTLVAKGALRGQFLHTKESSYATNASASGSIVTPLVVGPANSLNSSVTGAGKDEISGRRSVKNSLVSLPLSVTNASKLDAGKAWGLVLRIYETNTAGKTYAAATARLRFKDGTFTDFSTPRKLVYSAKNGYSLSFSKGQRLGTNGLSPILDAAGKPTIDKKSKIAISKMTLSKTNSAFAPTGGSMKYEFLGQKGQGSVAEFLK